MKGTWVQSFHSFSTDILSVSEEIITLHHPGEAYVIIKAVQTRHPCPFPEVDRFSVGNLRERGE